MKTRNVLGTTALAGVSLALLVWAFSPRPIEIEAAHAIRGPFERTIDEDGRTRVRDRYVVAAPLAGRLARIGLREGDAVASGATVATLAPILSPLLDERAASEQQARVEAARSLVARAQTRVGRARVTLAQAERELRRSEEMASTGFISLTKLDTDRLALEAAGKELEIAVEEQHVAEHDLQQARAAAQAVRQSSTSGGPAFRVQSPISGQVLRVVAASETTVALGAPLLELGDLAKLEIVAELLTADALQTPPGTQARIERWGGATVLDARVRRVEPAAFTKVSALGVEEQRVNVLIDLVEPRERWHALGDGYRVGVRLVTLALPDVVQVPVSAVFPRLDGQGMAVYRVEAGRARLVPVVVGARNGSMAWIRSGLDAGAVVIDFPPSAVRDGSRIRQRPAGQ